ncbi:DUF881 domain-containing protein [Streptomyces litchfieldiae]|uniref:DUF881 domain-containing protein n=1 Tax=Streptomyces litchfieldiae TaxID=3075543 RepID=A0ABU2MR48_9ACTN|nr:DUF881 domain-containing protein [Streptomyces sp. DSM 44938]MDT0343828.1 DUF881 domain-containing protein [Streptomyces sp. DSM 44938]
MPQQEPGRRVPARPDASMSLLTTVMSNTLDEGYAQAAARRRAEGRSELPRTLRARLWLAAGLVLAALVVTLGAAQAREAAPTLAREREELLDRVESGTADVDALQDEVNELRAEVADRQRDAIGDPESEHGELIALLAGATPVAGPGLELTVNDAEDAAPGEDAPGGGGFSDTGRVRDRDLQRVVNGLWQAGAEAISVNGQRLTALSAIRAAGDAVLVDNRPLVPPYTLLAIGAGDDLAAAFAGTPDGRYLEVLRDSYGIRTSTAVRDEVRLPAAPALAIRTARPAGTEASEASEEGSPQ